MAESFGQGEPLTVRISGLLTEYPPGDSTLKELLQNADDAGARTYAIDTTSHGKENLCDAGLAEHQGPALLVYNDAVFTKEDFDSLKRLGDSIKKDKRMATGKFGLGFNSVYGWTDTPSILTGRSFIALSPHERLMTPGMSKGLKIDFVNPPDGIDMTDQLEAFKLAAGPVDQEFAGTVIRIPFRTPEQAKGSEISSVAVTSEEVLTFFEKFQVDVAESLVFMRNIERVTFSIDGEELGATTVLHVDKIREARAAVSSAISKMISHSGAVRYEISQRYKHNACDIESTRTYHVQQTIFDMHTEVPNEFMSWAVKSKALPWIALAARLDEGRSPGTGRVFVTLPLPGNLDNTPVNIHGAFALRRDRRSLWTDNDAQGGTQLKEVDWNNFLFQDVMPVAWKQLLLELSHYGVRVSNYFPLMSPSTGPLWLNLTNAVLDQVLTERCRVWYSTTSQFLSINEGYLVDKVQDEALLEVLQGISMPLFRQVPYQVLKLLRSRDTYTTVNSTSVCQWLRQRYQQTNAPLLDVSDAMRILEYICRDGNLEQLHDVPVFLCGDGKLRSLSQRHTTANTELFNSTFYIGTDDEATLFDMGGELFLALGKYPPLVSTQIRKKILELSKTLNISRFGLDVFRKFCDERLFARIGLGFKYQYPETVKMSDCDIAFEWIQRLWCWLDKKPLAEVSEAISTSSRPLITQEGKGGDLIGAIHKMCGGAFRMVHQDFRVSTKGYLRSNRRILDPVDLEVILTSITPEVVNYLDKTLRDRLRRYLCSVIGQAEFSAITRFKGTLSKLPIFEKLKPCEDMTKSWLEKVYSSLPSQGVQPVPSVPCVPIIDNCHFFDSSAEDHRMLFGRLGYAILDSQQLLTKYIIPHFAAQPSWLLDHLAEFILSQANSGSISPLSSIAFVTVKSKDGASPERRLKPTEIIESNSSIAQLFFDYEAVFASGIYSDDGNYRNQMTLLGMKFQLDSEVAKERIRSYSTRAPDDEALFDKSTVLLQLLNKHNATVQFEGDWLPFLRLPAIKDERRCVLPASQCRSSPFKPLTDGVLGLVSVDVATSLQESLGWHLPFSAHIVAGRIDVIIRSASTSVVHSQLLPVLEYLQKLSSGRDVKITEYISDVKSSLSTRNWLPGVIDGLWPPERIFFRDARDFQPFLSELPLVFSENFPEVLLLFGVQKQPRPEQLVEFIATLDDSQSLSERKIEAVVHALNRLQAHCGFFSKELMIPDTHGRLFRIDQFQSPHDGDQECVRYAHSRVPRSIVRDYGIPQLEGDLNLFHHLNGPDLFDYCQEENIVDRISKSLKEASLWSAFNEFVANAEDSGSATSLTWLLDDQDVRFSSEKIFCEELKSWQNGALYVYNNGIFSDADFKALVQVGTGSKSNDSSKIGNYGLGALTMYMFTDVPSIISGEYFVMFDPRRQFLPFVPRSGRRLAGIKLPLAQMKSSFKDHLVPFIGIGGYSLDDPNFAGTIFRFPIRSQKASVRSPFKLQSESLTWLRLRDELEQSYCNQAHKSLIMLTRVENIGFRLRSSSAISSLLEEKSIWSLSTTHSPSEPYNTANNALTPFSRIEFSRLQVSVDRGGLSQLERWIVHRGYLSTKAIVPPQLRKVVVEEHLIANEDRVKHIIPDVAVAANLTNLGEQQFYNTLPLPERTGLPVSFHSRFAITPDRRTLRLESDWNKFLATSCIPTLYLVLLETLWSQPECKSYSYEHWPGSSNQKLHGLSYIIQESFWSQLLKCQYSLFANSNGLQKPISQTIFDVRTSNFRGKEFNCVLSFVQALRPSCVITNAEKVFQALSRSQVSHSDQTNVTKLDSAYVRGLLRERHAKTVLQREPFGNNTDFKSILKFCLNGGKLEELDQCWVLRLDDNTVHRFQILNKMKIGKAEIYYLVDKSGYNLLKGLVPGLLINPDACPFQGIIDSERSASFNVQPLNAAAVDKFVCEKLRPDLIKSYPEEDGSWINKVSRYSTAKSLAVDFHRTLPTIPLLNKPNTFISFEACKSLPIMPLMGEGLSQIADKLGLYVLGPSYYPPLTEIIRTWSVEERLLECLYCLVEGKCWALENKLRENLNDDDLEYLRKTCVVLFRKMRNEGRSFTPTQVEVLRFLPVWDRMKQSLAPTVSVKITAARAIIIPSSNWIFPGISKLSDFVVEDSYVREFMSSLGAKSFRSHWHFLHEYVFPCLPVNASPAQLPSLRKLLNFVVLHLSEWEKPHQLAVRLTKLIPDRGYTLRAPSSLYDPREPVFEAAFRGTASAFPHEDLGQIHLALLGVNEILTKENYFVCVRHFEQDYEKMQPDLFRRAKVLWSAFVNRFGQAGQWTAQDVQSLTSLHFVPVDRFISDGTLSYRDGILRGRVTERYAIFTMKEVISPQYAPIAWTKRPICAISPPTWASTLLNFSPSIEDVVQHLFDMSTVVASNCRITEAKFFDDLRNTYDYLQKPSHIAAASSLLLATVDKPIWLNEDISLEHLASARSSRYRVDNIAGLKWLSTESIYHDILFDLPKSNKYSIKLSLEPYSSLLRASGLKGFNSRRPTLTPENVEDHGALIFDRIKSMQESPGGLCDITIIIEGQRFRAHRVVLGTVSTYFHTLASGLKWIENGTGILDLDKDLAPNDSRTQLSPDHATLCNISSETAKTSAHRPYGTAESVALVIEWVYNGALSFDDGTLVDRHDIAARLDLYLDTLQLADVWDIPLLRTHIENRILRSTRLFIRAENVQGVRDRAEDYNANAVFKHCVETFQDNKDVVESVAKDGEN